VKLPTPVPSSQATSEEMIEGSAALATVPSILGCD
jgi:hypothetical protein